MRQTITADAIKPESDQCVQSVPMGTDGSRATAVHGARSAGEPREATPESAEEFYAELTARPDVRAFLKRLAGQ